MLTLSGAANYSCATTSRKSLDEWHDHQVVFHYTGVNTAKSLMPVRLVKSCTASKTLRVPFDILPFENIAFPAGLLYDFQPRRGHASEAFIGASGKIRVSLNTSGRMFLPGKLASEGRESRRYFLPSRFAWRDRIRFFASRFESAGSLGRASSRFGSARGTLAVRCGATTCTARRQSMN